MSEMTKQNVMLGSDPELLLEKTINGRTKAFPIIGLLGHGKDNPLHIDDSGFRTLQEDNVALEYTTHPTSNKADFITEQQAMLEVARAKAAEFGLTIREKSSAVDFEQRMLMSEAAKTFGCEPTWNAYTNAENPSPNARQYLRSVGGHIHISYDNPTNEKSMELAKLLDIKYLEHKADLSGNNDNARRRLYGKAGEIRLKSYGFEWRVLSNAWVFDARTIGLIWDIVEQVFEEYERGVRVKETKYQAIQRKVSSNEQLHPSAIDIYTFTLTPKPKKVVPTSVKKPAVKKTVAKKTVAKKPTVKRKSRKLVAA